MSHSFHQKWNSTSDGVDPWSITSNNVQSPLKKSTTSKQDTLLDNVAYWSKNWDIPLDNKIKKNPESPKTFFDVSSNKEWEVKVSPVKKKKSSIEEELNHQSRYKTELCRSWSETGSCRYGSKCQFAHGEAELRPLLRHPKYKTELCRSWAESGSCPYGSRCRFIHNEVDLKKNDKTELVNSFTKFQISNDNKGGQPQKFVSISENSKTEADKNITRLPFFRGLCL